MKVPLLWLRDYVDFDDTPEGLAERLTFSGIEVEGIAIVGADCPGIVAGEVREVRAHPGADRLSLCRVWDGAALRQVVCGAPNVAAGKCFPYAPDGTRLPGGAVLKKISIRGEDSEGMLCAEDELGLSDDHSGLLELDADCVPGTPLAGIIGPPQAVLELEITPNRPDCLSLLGVAREVAALYGTRMKRPAVRLEPGREPVEDFLRVEVKDTERCPRYHAQVLRGARIAPAPFRMRQRLKLAGVRPINNIVDCTNFVMLECGQPLHAFDRTLLAGGRIIVRRARDGEIMRTLDGNDRTLDSGMLVIADGERAIALAGIMGGANTEIGTRTEDVVLESACFAPEPIRRTARSAGLATESSHRFERGVDKVQTDWAGRRAAALMCELSGARIARGTCDIYPAPPATRSLACRPQRAASLLGMPVSSEELQQVFTALELPVRDCSPEVCRIDVPSFRGDLTREVDLIEEFARLRGLDRIPCPSPQAKIVPGARDRHARARSDCRTVLAGLGFSEVVHYSLVGTELLDLFDPENRAERVVLPHPISRDQSVLRPDLAPQMTATLGYNRARQVDHAALFEIGRVFHPHPGGPVREEERLALGLMGTAGRRAMDRRRPPGAGEMFLWLKGAIEVLAETLHAGSLRFTDAATPFLEPGFAAAVELDGHPAGRMGIVRENIRREWRLAEPVAVAELCLEPFLKRIFDRRPAQPPPAFPPVARDVALVAPPHVRHADIVAVMRRAAPQELEKIELFDLFAGKTLGDNRRGLAYSLTYRSPSKTLTDEETNTFHEQIKAALRQELDIDIRDS